MENSNKEKDPLDTPEINNAAYQFKTSMKAIKAKTRSLSKKSMERVFDAVIEFPLSQGMPNFRNKFEHELFVLSLNALAAKNQMMEIVVKHQTEATEKLKQAQENMKEGETNG